MILFLLGGYVEKTDKLWKQIEFSTFNKKIYTFQTQKVPIIKKSGRYSNISNQ